MQPPIYTCNIYNMRGVGLGGRGYLSADDAEQGPAAALQPGIRSPPPPPPALRHHAAPMSAMIASFQVEHVSRTFASGRTRLCDGCLHSALCPDIATIIRQPIWFFLQTFPYHISMWTWCQTNDPWWMTCDLQPRDRNPGMTLYLWSLFFSSLHITLTKSR
jgi:hypothetical protein